MNILIMTTMALSIMFMLGTIQPTEATVIQPAASVYQQDQVIPAYWHRGYRYYDDGSYYYEPYYRDPGLDFGFRLF